MKNLRIPAVTATALLTVVLAGLADDPETLDQLKEQLRALDEKVRLLEHNQEVAKEASSEKAKTSPTITVGAAGLSFSSPDTNFVFNFRGGFQIDGRYYLGETRASDTFLLRRLRPIFDGTVFRKFDYRVMLDFGSGISSSTFNNANVLDAYINYRILPEFQIQVGKFKEPVGLERLQSWNNLLFIERGLPTLLVPNRDTGVQLQGTIDSGLFQYAVGAFNGTTDGGSSDFDVDDGKDVAARIFSHPFKHSEVDALKGFGIGIAGTYGNHEGPLRNYLTPGQQQFFTWLTGAGTNAATRNVSGDGTQWRVTPQGYYYLGSFGLFWEYVISSQDVRRDAGGTPIHATVRNSAWQVAASWFLTGESNSWGRVQPKKNLGSRDGGWGALELAARVQRLDLDDDIFPLLANPAQSAGGVFAWGVGLNWYLNRNIKLSLDYERPTLYGAAGNASPFQEKNIIFTQAQFAF